MDRPEAAGLEPPDYPLPRCLATEPRCSPGRAARSLPAAEPVATLVAETDAALARLD